jgi:ATP/maltotriose-dependent transcriptional regulator MalT
MPLDPKTWHYHRVKDAERYVNLFNIGITTSIILFGEPGYGKTTFLLQDIKPLAEKYEYNVVYCSFLNNPTRPTQILLRAIKQYSQGFSDDTSIDVGNDLISELENIFYELSNKKNRTLFLFDDISYLSTQPDFSALIACIRTGLDQYSNKLCAIYTGSSQVELNRLFRDHTSPLYNFSRQHELTNMSIEFLYFISDNFTRKKNKS